MNERIKGLVYEAEKYALNKANEHDGDEDYENTFEDDFQEKFAELLVRECMDIIANEQQKVEPEWRCKSGHHIWWAIKEHFGVEL